MFAIVCAEFDGQTAYWTCNYHDTENYGLSVEDATLFRHKCFADAMVQTLGASDHYIVEVDDGILHASRSD